MNGCHPSSYCKTTLPKTSNKPIAWEGVAVKVWSGAAVDAFHFLGLT